MLPQCPACTNRRKRRVEAYSHCTGRPSTELSMLRVCTRTLLASQAACCTAYSNRTMLAGLSSLSTIEVSQEGPTAVVALNRPKQMNALSTEVMHELVDTVQQLDADSSVRSIIITGRGKAFAAGADIKEMANLDQKHCEAQQLFARFQDLGAGRRSWTPLIAAVNGIALGGGTELAMLCDIIIAADTAAFGLPEVTLSVIPGIGGTQRLPRLVGRALANDMMLTARRLSAQEALSAGLVSRVVPQDQLMAEAHAVADKIAGNPPGAVRKIMQASYAAENKPLDVAIKYERELFYSLFGTPDQREGMGAFLEKRKPTWQQIKGQHS